MRRQRHPRGTSLSAKYYIVAINCGKRGSGSREMQGKTAAGLTLEGNGRERVICGRRRLNAIDKQLNNNISQKIIKMSVNIRDGSRGGRAARRAVGSTSKRRRKQNTKQIITTHLKYLKSEEHWMSTRHICCSGAFLGQWKAQHASNARGRKL